MSDKQKKPAVKPAPAAAPVARHIKDIPLEDRLPDELKSLYLWWRANGNYFIAALCAACLLVAGYKWWQRGQERRTTEVGQAVRNAASGSAVDRVNTLEDVAGRHGNSTAGRQTRLLLAKAYYDAERHEDALGAYRHYIAHSPAPEFLAIALMGEAQSLEALNRPGEAQDAYEAFIQKYPDTTHFLRAEAEMGRARCLMLKGDKPAALLALEEAEARYAETDRAPRVEQTRGLVERYIPRAPRKRLSLVERFGSLELEGPAVDESPGDETLLEEPVVEESPADGEEAENIPVEE